MTFVAFGINHKTAPIEVREKVAINEHQIKHVLQKLVEHRDIDASVIISTCNRVEVYVDTKNINATHTEFAQIHNIDEEELKHYVYQYVGVNAIKHLMKVSAGLDSLILGETQILGQIKNSYKLSKDNGCLNSDFEKLFQKTFHAAKRIRTETTVGGANISVSSVAVMLVKHTFEDLSKLRFLIIGAGHTIKLVLQYLYVNGACDITIANRSIDTAKNLLKEFNFNYKLVISLSEIEQHLPNIDVVISSTSADVYMITYETLKAAMHNSSKRIILIDIAVPRDIDPSVKQLGNVSLYSVDDLKNITKDNMHIRAEAALEALSIIEEEAESFIQILDTTKTSNIISLMHKDAANIKMQLLESTLSSIHNGKDLNKVIHELVHNLTNQLLHKPTLAFKQLATIQNDKIIHSMENIFTQKEDKQLY